LEGESKAEGKVRGRQVADLRNEVRKMKEGLERYKAEMATEFTMLKRNIQDLQ
jgi:hypothetical protein